MVGTRWRALGRTRFALSVLLSALPVALVSILVSLSPTGCSEIEPLGQCESSTDCAANTRCIVSVGECVPIDECGAGYYDGSNFEDFPTFLELIEGDAANAGSVAGSARGVRVNRSWRQTVG